MRVPLIVRWPGGIEPTMVTDRVALLQGEHNLRLSVALPLHRHQPPWTRYRPSFALTPGGPIFGVQTEGAITVWPESSAA